MNTDREGVLFLNARLGVKEVDRGLEKEGVICHKAVKALYKILQKLIPGISVRANYVRRNVDENIIVLSIDPKTLGNFPRDELDTVIKKQIYEMDRAIHVLKEFKTTEKNSAFDSVAGGFFLKVPVDNFKDPEDVFKMVDFLSERYKRARRAALDGLISFSETDSTLPYFTRDAQGNLAIAVHSEAQRRHVEIMLHQLQDFFPNSHFGKTLKKIETDKFSSTQLLPVESVPGITFFQDMVINNPEALFTFLNLRDERIKAAWAKGDVTTQKPTDEQTHESVSAF